MPRSQNLAILKEVGRGFARKAVAATQIGQRVLCDGLRRRCPVGKTHDLINSIQETEVIQSKSGAYGEVQVTSLHAPAVEFGTMYMHAEPFIRPTERIDGPRAVKKMEDYLREA